MSPSVSNSIWLANRLIRDQWLAIVMTAIYFAFMGAVLANDKSYTVEFAHPLMLLILIQPSLNHRYMSLKQDNDVVRQQMFLRSLPLPFATMVGARATVMLLSGAINAILYFTMFLVFGDTFSSVSAWFAWSVLSIGVALVFAGMNLWQEFGLSMRRWSMVNLAIVIALGIAIVLVFWLLDVRPYRDGIAWATAHSLWVTLLGLTIGAVGWIGGYLLAIRSYRQREFPL